MKQGKGDRHKELGEFLRNRRGRLIPEQVGLSRGSRRRTAGLRREEVAMLTGVSVDWYTRLEQGRDIQVSISVLESLTKALQLDAIERRHLFMLAHRQPPPEDVQPKATISPTLKNFLNQLGTNPGCAIDPRMNVVAWNKAFCVVYGDYEKMTERERNLIWSTFTSSYFKEIKGEQWEEHALRFLAQFRAAYGRFIDDPWWTEQINELNRVSPEFRELWGRHDVLNTPEGRKLINHPIIGELGFEHISFQVIDSPDLQVLINIPIEEYNTSRKISQLLFDTNK
ncbi:helix-turn-helix transcriptional regulator [Peribacillus frigoritolerans]|uniref:helix-turn-helix transcriptional regulator n=1 Tax=Peribacillus castrilensis TaxID=2897690 RepID=UPI003DA5F410